MIIFVLYFQSPPSINSAMTVYSPNHAPVCFKIFLPLCNFAGKLCPRGLPIAPPQQPAAAVVYGIYGGIMRMQLSFVVINVRSGRMREEGWRWRWVVAVEATDVMTRRSVSGHTKGRNKGPSNMVASNMASLCWTVV